MQPFGQCERCSEVWPLVSHSQMRLTDMHTVSGNGQTSKAAKTSEVQCSIAQIGMIVFISRAKRLLWSDPVPLPYKLYLIYAPVSEISPQNAPWLADDSIAVKQLQCFIRSASWVTAGFGSNFAGKDGGNFKCSSSKPLQVRFWIYWRGDRYRDPEENSGWRSADVS